MLKEALTSSAGQEAVINFVRNDTCVMPDHSANPDASPNRFYAYGVIARLAMLAASIEIDQPLNETELVAAT